MTKKEHKQTRIIAVAALAVAVLGLTTAFALLSTTLSITGQATIKGASWQVGYGSDCAGAGIDQSTSVSKTGQATATLGTVSATSAQFNVDFVAPGDTATLALPIKNCGTIPAKIASIDVSAVSGLSDNSILWSYRYASTIDGTNAGVGLQVGDVLSAGVVKPTTFTMTNDNADVNSGADKSTGYTVTVTYEQKD